MPRISKRKQQKRRLMDLLRKRWREGEFSKEPEVQPSTSEAAATPPYDEDIPSTLSSVCHSSTSVIGDEILQSPEWTSSTALSQKKEYSGTDTFGNKVLSDAEEPSCGTSVVQNIPSVGPSGIMEEPSGIEEVSTDITMKSSCQEFLSPASTLWSTTFTSQKYISTSSTGKDRKRKQGDEEDSMTLVFENEQKDTCGTPGQDICQNLLSREPFGIMEKSNDVEEMPFDSTLEGSLQGSLTGVSKLELTSTPSGQDIRQTPLIEGPFEILVEGMSFDSIHGSSLQESLNDVPKLELASTPFPPKKRRHLEAPELSSPEMTSLLQTPKTPEKECWKISETHTPGYSVTCDKDVVEQKKEKKCEVKKVLNFEEKMNIHTMKNLVNAIDTEQLDSLEKSFTPITTEPLEKGIIKAHEEFISEENQDHDLEIEEPEIDEHLKQPDEDEDCDVESQILRKSLEKYVKEFVHHQQTGKQFDDMLQKENILDPQKLKEELLKNFKSDIIPKKNQKKCAIFQPFMIAEIMNKGKMFCPLCEAQSTLDLKFVEKEGTAVFNQMVSLKCKACSKEIGKGRCSDMLSIPEDFIENVKTVSTTAATLTAGILSAGVGYTKMARVLSTMNMAPLSLRTYQVNKQWLAKAMDKRVNDMKVAASAAVKDYYTLKGVNYDEGLLNIPVSFDQTFMKRGHDSLISAGYVIEVETGVALDFHVFSKHCALCDSMQKKREKCTEEEFKILEEKHKPNCKANFEREKSSGSMEAETAKLLFSRSEELGFRYTTIVSDEDSSTYKTLVESKIYGDRTIEKQNCLNHLNKKVYKRLEKASSESHCKFSKISAQFFANIYRSVIKQHTGNYRKIRQLVLASVFHHASTDDIPMHSLCPSGKKSWCKYQKQKSEGKEIESNWHKNKKNLPHNLDAKSANVLLRVLQDLLTDDVLARASGRTQNANESLHGRLWQICPKHVFRSKIDVEYAAGYVFLNYNCGARGSNILDETDLSIGDYTAKQIKLDDKIRKKTVESKKAKRRKRNDRLKGDRDYAPGEF